jgi:hydroxylamine dehydrogenase
MKMWRIGVFLAVLTLWAASAGAQPCVDCHTKVTPNIVSDWRLSKHSANNVDCAVCHGDKHKTAEDAELAELATPETCRQCHPARVEQFEQGKHAKAWTAVKVMPTTHWQPAALFEGMQGCTGCHNIGLKTEEEIRELRIKGGGYGVASCDACHTRHVFSTREASAPQACRTCHMGIDHPQWEMFESSKHGVRYLLRQTGVLPPQVAAPSCQVCHMPEGTHRNKTAWGFLAVRLPLPEDKQWADDRTTVLKGLGVLDPDGNPTPRLEAIKAADVVRLEEEEWRRLRSEMISICSGCHSRGFAENQLRQADSMIREADRLMAQGIEIVAGLYRDGVLEKPKNYPYAYPDLLTFHDAPTKIEQELFLMFLKHRMRTFQGAFHINPDYTLWYGWSEMVRDLTSIREQAETLRRVSEKLPGETGRRTGGEGPG